MRFGIIGSTLVLGASLTITQLAKADDGNHGKGHHIHGVETFVAHIVLSPTDSAPDGSGRLDLQAFNHDGIASSQMEIQTFGLDTGDYNVAALLKSDGSSVSVGTITVGNPHSHGNGNENGKGNGKDNGNGNGHGENHGKAKGHYRSANHFVLPDSVDPSDISQITVADSTGTTDLIGDFVNLAKGSFVSMKANVKVAPGDAAPDATGNASLSVVAVGTNVTGSVTVAASNLPTNTVLNVTANDQPVATVTTTKSGSTVLRNLRDTSLQSSGQVTLTTTSGSTAATANF